MALVLGVGANTQDLRKLKDEMRQRMDEARAVISSINGQIAAEKVRVEAGMTAAELSESRKRILQWRSEMAAKKTEIANFKTQFTAATIELKGQAGGWATWGPRREFTTAGMLQAVGVVAGGMGLVQGVKSAATALTDAALSGAEFAHSLELISQKTGIAVPALQQMAFIGKTTGLDLQDVVVAVRKFSTALVGGAGEDGLEGAGGRGTKILAALGIATRDAAGAVRPMNEVLLDLAEVFAKNADGPQKARIAIELFGRSGLNLIPFLDKGKDGVRELLSAMGDTVPVEELAKAYEKLEVANAKLDQANLRLKAGLVPLLDFWANLKDGVAAYLEQLTAVAQEHRNLAGAAGVRLAPAGEAMFAELTTPAQRISVKGMPVGADVEVERQKKLAEGEAEFRRRFAAGIAPGAVLSDEQRAVGFILAQEGKIHEKLIAELETRKQVTEEMKKAARIAAGGKESGDEARLLDQITAKRRESWAEQMKMSRALGEEVSKENLTPAAFRESQVSAREKELLALRREEVNLTGTPLLANVTHQIELERELRTLVVDRLKARREEGSILDQLRTKLETALREAAFKSFPFPLSLQGRPELKPPGDALAGDKAILEAKRELAQIEAVATDRDLVAVANARAKLELLQAQAAVMRAQNALLDAQSKVLVARVVAENPKQTEEQAREAARTLAQAQTSEEEAQLAVSQAIANVEKARLENHRAILDAMREQKTLSDSILGVMSTLSEVVSRFSAGLPKSLSQLFATFESLHKLNEEQERLDQQGADWTQRLASAVGKVAVIVANFKASVAQGIGATLMSIGQGLGGPIGAVMQVGGGILQIIAPAFTKAAKRIAKEIGKAVNATLDAFNAGDKKLRDALKELERQRQDAINRLSGRKGGKKELEALLPEIDKAMADLKKRQKEIFEGFDRELANLALPEALRDIGKTIDQLNEKVKEFLDAGGSALKAQEYVARSLQDIYKSTRQDLSDAEQETIDLLQQEIDLQKQRQQIIEDAAKAEHDVKSRLGLARTLTPAQQANQEIKAIREARDEKLKALDEEQKRLDAQLEGRKELFGLQADSNLLLERELELIRAGNLEWVDRVRLLQQFLTTNKDAFEKALATFAPGTGLPTWPTMAGITNNTTIQNIGPVNLQAYPDQTPQQLYAQFRRAMEYGSTQGFRYA
jgi:hypothetical protein